MSNAVDVASDAASSASGTTQTRAADTLQDPLRRGEAGNAGGLPPGDPLAGGAGPAPGGGGGGPGKSWLDRITGLFGGPNGKTASPPGPTAAADRWRTPGWSSNSPASQPTVPGAPAPTQAPGTAPPPTTSEAAPGASTSTDAAPTRAGSTGTVSVGSLFLRDAPGDGKKLAQFPKGTPVVIDAKITLPDRTKNADWYAVRVGGAAGYMAADMLSLDPGSTEPPTRPPAPAEQPTKTDTQPPGPPPPAPAPTGGNATPKEFDPKTTPSQKDADPAASEQQQEPAGQTKGRENLDLSDPASPLGQLWKQGEFKQFTTGNLIGQSVEGAFNDPGVIATIRKESTYGVSGAWLKVLSDKQFLEQARIKTKRGEQTLVENFVGNNCVAFTMYMDYNAKELRALELKYQDAAAIKPVFKDMLTKHWIQAITSLTIKSSVDFSTRGAGTFAMRYGNGDTTSYEKSKTLPTIKVKGEDPAKVAGLLRDFDQHNCHIRVGNAKNTEHSFLGRIDGNTLKSFDMNQGETRGDVDISENPNVNGSKPTQHFYGKGKGEMVHWVAIKPK